MNLPKINAWTAVVVIAGIAGIVAMIHYKADPEKIGAYSIAIIALAAQLQKLFPGKATVLALAFAGTVSCTPDARRALLETAIDGAACAIAHQHLSDADIIKVCSIQAADIDRILRLLGESRKAAMQARADEQAKAGVCRDAGADAGDAGAR